MVYPMETRQPRFYSVTLLFVFGTTEKRIGSYEYLNVGTIAEKQDKTSIVVNIGYLQGTILWNKTWVWLQHVVITE